MKLLIYFSIFCCITGCFFTKKAAENEFQKVMFTVEMPTMELGRDTFSIKKDTLYLTTYKNYKLYEASYREVFTDDGVLLSDTIFYDFFIFNINTRKGFNIKKMTALFEKKVNLDSFELSRTSFTKIKADTIIKNYPDATRIINNKSKIVFSNMVADKEYDSVKLYFNSDLKDFPFYMSRTLDSMYGSKYYQLEMFGKKGWAQGIANSDNDEFDKVTVCMHPMEIKNKEAFLKLFKRFENTGN